ncbi:hypothetical protein J5X75_29970 [Actinoplanes sp. NEAU-H7]|uniref:Uncharacterized protein n=1 Tax=Actinoplanes flavus TaxID=2820290 RepID=A0ABS3UT46_9ACTN|nr:hypothetical protein [Actinoplanes flavus]
MRIFRRTARVDRVAPSTTELDNLKSTEEPATEGLLGRLIYASLPAERSEKSRVFLANAGIGFEIGPRGPMYQRWSTAYRATPT